MATEIIMPKNGMDMTEGVLIRWLKNVAEQVLSLQQGRAQYHRDGQQEGVAGRILPPHAPQQRAENGGAGAGQTGGDGHALEQAHHQRVAH